MISKYKNILTFFAHPDDETLAAGATINKLSKNGCRIHVAIPADGVNEPEPDVIQVPPPAFHTAPLRR